jgi:L-lactate utilization protein LutC
LKYSSSGTAVWASDNNTWRSVQDNLTSTSTDDSLTANQGRLLKLKTHTQSSQTNSGTVTLNLDASNNHNITLSGNSTLALSNIANNVGVSGNIILQQDATGGRTVALASEMKTPLGGAGIDFVTTANTTSALSYYVVSSTMVLVNYIGNFA